MFYLNSQHSYVVFTFPNININQRSTCSNLILFLSRNNKYTKPFSGEFLLVPHFTSWQLAVSCFVLQLSAKIAPTKASAAQAQAELHSPAQCSCSPFVPLPALRAPFFPPLPVEVFLQLFGWPSVQTGCISCWFHGFWWYFWLQKTKTVCISHPLCPAFCLWQTSLVLPLSGNQEYNPVFISFITELCLLSMPMYLAAFFSVCFKSVSCVECEGRKKSFQRLPYLHKLLCDTKGLNTLFLAHLF